MGSLLPSLGVGVDGTRNEEPIAGSDERLRTEFKEAQELAKHAEFNVLTFTAFVRAPQQKEFVEFTFSGADVHPDKISEGGSIMGGNALTFVLRRPGKGPFDGGQFMIDEV